MKKTISILVTIFVISAVFTGCSKDKKNAKGLTDFHLGVMPGTSHLFAFVGAEEGFFQEEGLNITISQFASSGEMVAGLESGKLDAALIGSVPSITQQAAGHDITIFGGAMTNGHGLIIKSKFIPTGFKEGDVAFLKGHNIASVINSIQDYELQYVLRKNGIEIGEGSNKVNVFYFGSQKDAYAALAGGQIDGSVINTPFASRAKNDGHTVVYHCYHISDFENQPCCRQVTLTKSLADKPDIYLAFERAVIKAYKFSQENHAKTVENVAKYIDLDKKDIEYEIYNGHAFSSPDPDKKATTKLKTDIVAFGYSNGVDYNIDEKYNLDIYKKALAQIIAKNPNDPIYKSLEEHFKSAN